MVSVDEVCSLIVDCVNKTAPVVSEVTLYRMIRTTNVRNGRMTCLTANTSLLIHIRSGQGGRSFKLAMLS